MNRKQHKVIEKFIGCSNYGLPDWDFIMEVVAEIERIIECAVQIDNNISITWFYSPAKVTRFSKGFGGGGGGTVKRTLFDCISGKYHEIHIYYSKEKINGIKKQDIVSTKKEAVYLACYRWVEWYNKTVLNK